VDRKLECELSVPARLRAGEPVPLSFRLTNRSAQPLAVLTWHTPLEGLLSNALEVTRDGAPIGSPSEDR
jgi:peptidyl-Lys metalloendopeptidase